MADMIVPVADECLIRPSAIPERDSPEPFAIYGPLRAKRSARHGHRDRQRTRV